MPRWPTASTDELGAADLARAHDLAVVDEEDGDLRPASRISSICGLPVRRSLRREAAGADLADAVGLIEDDDVEGLVDVVARLRK